MSNGARKLEEAGYLGWTPDRQLKPGARFFEIGSWPTHPLFVQAHAEAIEAEIASWTTRREGMRRQIEAVVRRVVLLLFFGLWRGAEYKPATLVAELE